MPHITDIVVALMRERREAQSLARKRAADLLLAATLEGEVPINVADVVAREERSPNPAIVEEMARLAASLGLDFG